MSESIFSVEENNFVVIDSILPSKNPIGPRNSDFLEFSRLLPSFKYYTMYPMPMGEKSFYRHTYGMSEQQFEENLKLYGLVHPNMESKFEWLNPSKTYKFKLAYTYFLAETYTLLPFLEKNKIPFAFLLNPGGGLGFDNEASDNMLREIFSSSFFRKVFVNQKRVEEYLLKKQLCSADKIIYDFTGSVQFKPQDVVEKKFFPSDKSTFDLCFVAAKYRPLGKDKGYDLFIEAAKKLAPIYPNMHFHVVGGFDENEIDVSSIKDKITFYGYMKAEELPHFYSHMDIFLSPSRINELYPGNFHGFPLSAGAMYCGVCGFNADELNLNTEFDEDEEVVIIETNSDDIVNKVEYFYQNLEKLYEISKNGQKKAMEFWDIEKHIKNRISVFNKIMEEEK